MKKLLKCMCVIIINPRRACAARVTVCLSVCLSATILALQVTRRYQQLQCYIQGQEMLCGDFAETTAFERYGVKTSEKANIHNEHWVTSTMFSPFSAPLKNEVTKGICIQFQRCSKPTHDHAASL